MGDRRLLIPVVAGLILAGVSVWRLQNNRTQSFDEQVAAARTLRPAPLFERLDSDNHLVRLGTFVGRHPILLIFFDGESGADRDPDLLTLRRRFDDLNARGVKVLAISAAIPQVNRAAIERTGAFPFPLLSDFDPRDPAGTLLVHALYGRLNSAGQPEPGVFLIDRKGQIEFRVAQPLPQPDLNTALQKLLN